jgi:hypothetical protein
MPLEPGEDTGEAIDELQHGKTYARTKKKFGKKKARKQSIAIALKNKRKGKMTQKRARK